MRALSWTAVTALCLAAVALGQALQAGNGMGNPSAFRWLLAAMVGGLVGVLSPEIPALERLGERAPLFLLWAGLLWQMGDLLVSRPGMYVRAGAGQERLFLWGLGAAAVLGAAGLWREGWFGRLRFPALLALHLLLGAWLLHASPHPHIDVFTFHREAFRALAAGRDPYAITMPNIYRSARFYGPGLVKGRRVLVGYPYLPLSLGLGYLGHVVGGDYRWANLVAITAAGALIGYARPGRLAEMAAALLLFTPRVFFVIEQGWTEAQVVFFIALAVFCACRLPRVLPWVLGLLLATKQYAFALLPLFLLLIPGRRGWRERLGKVGLAAAFGLALSLFPLAFGAAAYWHSVVGFHVAQPFRKDALSFLALWAHHGGHPPLWLGFALLLPAVALGWWRAPRSPAGFAAAAALVFLVFFAFSKQAFCNYYFFVLAALCAAAGSAGAGAGAAAGSAVSEEHGAAEQQQDDDRDGGEAPVAGAPR